MAQNTNANLGCVIRSISQDTRKNSSILFHSFKVPFGVLCGALGVAVEEGCLQVGQNSRGNRASAKRRRKQKLMIMVMAYGSVCLSEWKIICTTLQGLIELFIQYI